MISKFEIYTGKKDEKEKPSKQKLTMGGHIVLTMTDHLCGKKHKFFFDNYFSSVPLMEILQGQQLLACGTIRSNRRDFPPLANDKSLKRGDFDFRSTPSGIAAYKWMDSKAVHLITNYHGIEINTVQRKEKDGTKVVVTCPQVVKDYNDYMGGVDKHDMLRQMYGVNRKSKKWWHRIFFGLFDMAIVNAYVIYKEANAESAPMLGFRRELAQGLLTLGKSNTSPGASKRRKIAYSVPASVRFNNTGVHWPHFIEKKGRCEVCSKKGVESRPFSICSHCGIHLCCNASKNCFREFHS